MEYGYISTGVKTELLRFGMDCDWKEQVVIVGGGPMVICSSEQTVFSLPHMVGIILVQVRR